MKDDMDECVVLGRQLSEPARFAYAGLCGVTMAQLFPEKEQRSFCTEFLEDLVMWLALSDSVLPAMEAFASGLGGEGTDTFTKMLLEESAMKVNPALITQDLVTFSLRDGYYDARARVLITHITRLLCVSEDALEVFEESLSESLKQSKEKPSEMAEASRKKREKKKKMKRYLLIGLATVGGGTVIGLTGGLAAPFVAAGAATIIGTAGAAALGSTAGIAIMASLFGAAGAGLTGYKMKKRVGAIEEFEFLPLTGGRHLHISIAITGWLCTGKYGSFAAPWQSLLQSTEQYCLAWESKYLMELGNTLDALLNGLVNMVAQEALKYTVLSGIVTALTWPASLLAVASVIDNPWGVCLSRSAEVGKHLAHILLSRQQGRRPVTLVGFSLGARVIYFCLQEMAREKDCEGIIEDVVMLGAPVEGDAKYWSALTKVVAGRIINGYCRGDWLLSFVYRSSSVKLNVAGLQPVRLDDRRMVNVDLSSVVNGHLDYMKQMDVLLKAVGIKTKEGHLGELKSDCLFPEGLCSKAEPTCALGAGAREENILILESEEGKPSVDSHHGIGELEQITALLKPEAGTMLVEDAHNINVEQDIAFLKPPVGTSNKEQSINFPKSTESKQNKECAQSASEGEQSSAKRQPPERGKNDALELSEGGASEGEQRNGHVCVEDSCDTREVDQSGVVMQPAKGIVCLEFAADTGKPEQSSAVCQPTGSTCKSEPCSTLLQPSENNVCKEGPHNTSEGEQIATLEPKEAICPQENSRATRQPVENKLCIENAHDINDVEQSTALFMSSDGEVRNGNTCKIVEKLQGKSHSEPAAGHIWGDSCTQLGEQQDNSGNSCWTWDPVD
ncbi:transmembrane and coiled-coil domain-containing protein 4 isoform X2 [Pleurodeles waltl]